MLSTKNVKVGGPSKTLEPGNTTVSINSVMLVDNNFKPGSKHLILNVVGPDLGDDFEGFFINKDQPDLGRHKGAIGRVRTSDFPYADFKDDAKGIDIKRDNEIMKAVKRLCIEMGMEEWYNAQDEQHATIEDFIEQFNNDKPFKNIKLDVCLAGNQYENKEGYTNYDLYLPKSNKNKVSFELAGKNSGKLMTYQPAIHLEVRKPKEGVAKEAVKPVDAFEAETPAGKAKKSKVDKSFDL